MPHTPALRLLLVLAILPALPCSAQQTAHLSNTKALPAKPAPVKVIPASQHVFGSIGIASKSIEARQQLEIALERYENAQYPESIEHSKIALKTDPNCALAFALWSYAARWTTPSPDAVQKALALSAKSAADEKLLVKFMTGTQEADALPAIMAMNDLVNKHPKDKHVLYLAGEWLFFQEDYVRGRELMEKSLQLDPKFPPALNTLGYAYVESLDPEPAKGIDLLRRYAEVLPDDPNPQDSLGEVLRMIGDDSGSLARYAAALDISPTFITSQYGRGDTYTLMGKYGLARAEYDKALKIAKTEHDVLHIEFQNALVYFWQRDPRTGGAELAKLSEKAAEANDSMRQRKLDGLVDRVDQFAAKHIVGERVRKRAHACLLTRARQQRALHAVHALFVFFPDERERQQKALRIAVRPLSAGDDEEPTAGLPVPFGEVEQRDPLRRIGVSPIPSSSRDERRQDVALEVSSRLLRHGDPPRDHPVAEQARPAVEEHEHGQLLARRTLFASRRDFGDRGEPEPEKAMSGKRQRVILVCDRRKARSAQQFDRHAPLEPR